jgi:nitroreductase
MQKEEILHSLEWRYATKQFDPDKKITAADWQILEKSLVFAPSSYGLQPWKFLIIQNAELREKLKPASWNQTQVTDCSHYVVFLYKEKMDEAHIEKFLTRHAEVHELPLQNLSRYKEVMMQNLVHGPESEISHFWAQRQAYIAMGFLMETAALLKIDTCPMEGLDGAQYDSLLNLIGTGFKTVASVALGYRHENDKHQSLKKVRFPAESVIEWRK